MNAENLKTIKPYSLEFEQRADYLYAYVSGETDSLDISRGFWREIADECQRVTAGKLLIVEDIKEIVSMADMYQIASEIPQLGFSGVRIAFVDRYIDQHDLNSFGEIVATNRGIHGKIFNDVDEAIGWLSTK